MSEKKPEIKSDKKLADKLNKFLKENKIKVTPIMGFPNYNKMPADLELALLIIQKHEPEISIDVIAEK